MQKLNAMLVRTANIVPDQLFGTSASSILFYAAGADERLSEEQLAVAYVRKKRHLDHASLVDRRQVVSVEIQTAPIRRRVWFHESNARTSKTT